MICPKCKSIRVSMSDWHKDQVAHAWCRECQHRFTVRVEPREMPLPVPPAPPAKGGGVVSEPYTVRADPRGFSVVGPEGEVGFHLAAKDAEADRQRHNACHELSQRYRKLQELRS